MKISNRADIAPFIVMDVMKAAAERAASGADVLHMEVGQPATAAPAGVIAAAKQALDKDVLGYTLATGIAPLRQRIADHYRDQYGLDIAPSRICVTSGSSAGFLLSFLAAFDAGDTVAITRPGYPCYRHILRSLGLNVVEIACGPAAQFRPTVAALEQTIARSGGRRPDGLLIASPANPTGTMLSAKAMAAMVDYCRDNKIRYLSDEIYHGISFGDPAVSALAYSDDVVVINSFSKYFSMTGWRLGWLVLPDDMIRPVERLSQNLFICAPALSQAAAVAAFDCHDELQANIRRYRDNRALLLERLPAAGIKDFAPADGAFYLYADVRHLTNDAVAFCQKALAETGVAITPGNDFDAVDGHGYVRFSFAGATAEMAAAVDRLQAWLKQ